MDYLNDLTFLTELDKLNIRKHYVRLVLLSFDEKPIKTIEGNVTAGSLTVNGSSAVRRTISLTMLANDLNSNLEDIDNEISVDKKIKVYVGYENPLKKYAHYGSTIWFPCGLFILTSASISRSTSGWTISITGKDKMCMLDGTVGGTFPASIVLSERIINLDDGTSITQYPTIFQIIFEVVHHWGGEAADNIFVSDLEETVQQLDKYNGVRPIYFNSNYSSLSYSFDEENYPNEVKQGQDIGYEETKFTYPGELAMNAGDTVVKVLDKIVNVLGNFEYFYDLEGRFRFQEIKNYLNTGSPLINYNDYDANGNVVEQHSGISAQDYVKSYNNAKFLYSLTDLDTTTAVNRNPKYDNIKNDFYVWGVRKTATGVEIPIRYHLAIDVKPEINLAGQWMWEIRDNLNTLLPYQFTSTKDRSKLVVGENYQEPKIIGCPCGEWREELYRLALQAQVTTSVYNNYYDPELIAEWRNLYSYDEESEKMEWNSNIWKNPKVINYWLDFIDDGSAIGKYSINKIGRRTKVVNNSGATSIYNSQVPEILFVRIENYDSDFAEKWKKYGKQVFLLNPSLYDLFTISTTGASCFDQIREMLYQNLNYNTSITLTCLPKYYMEPNNIIYIYDKKSNIDGNYQITQFTLPLTYNGTMSITATEVLTRV